MSAAEILTINNNAPQTAYFYREDRKTVKWTGRKIILAVLEMFSFTESEFSNVKYLLVWGSTSADWIFFIANLFHKIEIHYYVHEKMGLPKNLPDNVKVYRHLFNDDDVKEWYIKHNETMILGMYKSHIPKNANDKQTETEHWEDMVKMRKWIYTIRPLDAFIYFRPPYWTQDMKIDRFTFLKGSIFLPVWDSANSTYVWIRPERYADGKYEALNLDAKTWEDRMMYHNSVVRENREFNNNILYNGLNRKFDSYAEISILTRFFSQFKIELDKERYIKAMVDSITNVLNMHNKDKRTLKQRMEL